MDTVHIEQNFILLFTFRCSYFLFFHTIITKHVKDFMQWNKTGSDKNNVVEKQCNYGSDR